TPRVLKLFGEADGRAYDQREAASRQPLEAPPTAADVEQQIRRLDRAADKTARLEALRWLEENSELGSAGRALAALERCARESDPAIRDRALPALSLVAYHQKLACPLPILEALLDKHEDVRWQATN